MSTEIHIDLCPTIVLDPWRDQTMQKFVDLADALRHSIIALEEKEGVRSSLRLTVIEHARVRSRGHRALQDAIALMESPVGLASGRCVARTLAAARALARLIDYATCCLRTLPDSFTCDVAQDWEQQQIAQLREHAAELQTTGQRHLASLQRAATLVENEITALQRALVALVPGVC